MKSVKLNAKVREEIKKSMMTAWALTNKEPYNLVKLEHTVAIKLHRKIYGKHSKSINNISDYFLCYSNDIYIKIGDIVSHYKLPKSLPCFSKVEGARVNVVEVYNTEPNFITDFLNKRATCIEWRGLRRRADDEIQTILDSVNTTKQLLEIWPEAERYLPIYITDPSKGIKLPALQTNRLNASLGINAPKP